MINPIGVNSLNKNSGLETKKSDEKSSFNARETELYPLNYKVGRAFAGMSGITFKNLAKPVEVTNLYNKKVEGKDHLDLPNIHVYEFPDTNLQVFIDENPNMAKDSNEAEVRFFLGKSSIKGSALNNRIIMEVLKSKLAATIENADLYKNNSGFYTICTSLTSDKLSHIADMNNIINNFEVSPEELEKVKQNIMRNLMSEETQKHCQYLIMLDNDVKAKSIEEVENELAQLTPEKLKDYYTRYISGAEAQYFITVNSQNCDKDELFKNLNKNINTKYAKKQENPTAQKWFYNKSLKVIYNNTSGSDNAVSIIYPARENNMKDAFTNLFTDMLLVFLIPPYHDEKSGMMIPEMPDNIINSDKKYIFHDLKFSFPKSDFVTMSAENAGNIQKALFKMVIDTDFTVTLNDIKEYYKQSLNEQFNLSYMKDKNNENLYNYGYDAFQLYEIIDSIEMDDIKEHIQKYLIEQEPIIIMNRRGENIEDSKNPIINNKKIKY